MTVSFKELLTINELNGKKNIISVCNCSQAFTVHKTLEFVW